ncbi:hypothetical protein GA565_10860 [Rouxiella sp. S1S-2]|uniref:hypothetical protein n=1 Tax=Rouxiella sp. S1S-2 TaxID=2653856 RepID=UPI0012651FAA|nr:hypothetical protein [Rouxiella sp. S1S-2]KAB7896443.1 hypothetical protein GA565_10860 [Rouxiella sp. S1S-2]
MPDIYYPHDYLPAPLLPTSGEYGFKPVSPLLRSPLTSGRARQRRAFTSAPTQTSVKWLFKKDGQAQYFEAWFKHVLSDGVAWFYMKLKTPLGVELYKCRFTDIYDGPYFLAPRGWQFSATLELWERPVLPAESLEFPDYIVNGDIIDIAANREWPQS